MPFRAVYTIRMLAQFTCLEAKTIVLPEVLNVDIIVFAAIRVSNPILREPAAIQHLVCLLHGQQLLRCHMPVTQASVGVGAYQ